ncbi:MAG: cytochrome c3 family protein, partial [Anaerolineales bacterium]
RLITGIVMVLLTLWMTASLVEAQTPTATPEPETETGFEVGGAITHDLVGRSNCLICHETGFEQATIIPEDHLIYTNEECRECHQPDVSSSTIIGFELVPGQSPTPLSHPPSEGLNSCYDCHILLDDEKHVEISEEWEASVHGQAGIGCVECHGGDARTDEMNLSMTTDAGFIGVPPRAMIPSICGGCHSDVERMSQYGIPTDQYSKYIDSVHGKKLLEEGDTRVALCIDCHGTHNIKQGSDPTSDIFPLNIPALCAKCHSDPQLMETYDIPTDQYDSYEQSVHGQALLVNQDMRAANCASCHGSHAAKPPNSHEVINVCGKCHTATQSLYEESLHSRIGDNGPQCWHCHGTHDVVKPSEDIFFHAEEQGEKHCGTCHVDNDEFRMDRSRFDPPADRRCDTCHHEESMIMTQVSSLHTALSDADHAYQKAEAAIERAGALGMIVDDAENKLAEARTSLIRARANLHTTKLPVVSGLSDESQTFSTEALAMAKVRLSENLFRRQAMVVAVIIILLNMAFFYLLKRRYDRQLD